MYAADPLSSADFEIAGEFNLFVPLGDLSKKRQVRGYLAGIVRGRMLLWYEALRLRVALLHISSEADGGPRREVEAAPAIWNARRQMSW